MQLQWMGRALLANEQGGPLAQLKVTPEQTSLHQTLGAVVVHAAAVLQCMHRVTILQPFTNMLNNPRALAVSTIHTESNCNMLTLFHFVTSECIPSHDARRFFT